MDETVSQVGRASVRTEVNSVVNKFSPSLPSTLSVLEYESPNAVAVTSILSKLLGILRVAIRIHKNVHKDLQVSRSPLGQFGRIWQVAAVFFVLKLCGEARNFRMHVT